VTVLSFFLRIILYVEEAFLFVTFAVDLNGGILIVGFLSGLYGK
jgi:hypothetical protein